MKKRSSPQLRTIAWRLLDVFGVDGKHWIEGNYNDGDGNYCLVGGLEKIGQYQQREQLNQAIADYDPNHDTKDYCVEQWNDSHEWKDIRAFLMKLAHPYQPKKEKL